MQQMDLDFTKIYPQQSRLLELTVPSFSKFPMLSILVLINHIKLYQRPHGCLVQGHHGKFHQAHREDRLH